MISRAPGQLMGFGLRRRWGGRGFAGEDRHDTIDGDASYLMTLLRAGDFAEDKIPVQVRDSEQ